MRMIIDDQVSESARRTAAAIPAARRSLLARLAAGLERGAIERATGGSRTDPGAYPIPVRTGTFRRAFGLQVAVSHALVFNATIYARSLHEGYLPYGNPNATPIPGRPYFDDALQDLDVPGAVQAWEESLPWR